MCYASVFEKCPPYWETVYFSKVSFKRDLTVYV